MKPANIEDELKKGRIVLWLTPEQIAFIANEWRKIPETATPHIKEYWSTIAFRAITALHKSGIAYEPEFPNESEIYHLTNHSSGPAKFNVSFYKS